MVIKIGPVEFQVVIANHPGKDFTQLSLQDLHSSVISVVLSSNPIPRLADANPELSKPSALSESESLDYLAVLKAVGFTNHTLTMVIKKTLSINVSGETLLPTFNKYYRPALEWLTRPLQDDIWAIYIGVTEPSRFGRTYVAVGVDKNNVNTVLGINQKSVGDLYKGIIGRGVNPNKISFGMLSLEAGTIEEFRKAFPEATVGRDWNEYIRMTDDESARSDLKEAMMSMDEKFALKIVKKYKAPQELLNYYKFESKFWRSFRTLGPIDRIDTELRSKVRQKSVKTADHMKLVVAMSLLRLQYQWTKYPIDSPNLNNLPHLRAYAEVMED